MKECLLLFCFVAVQSFAADYETPIKVAKNTIIIKEREHTPRKDKKCIKRSPAGECREYDYTYGVQGVTCTENCIDFDSFDQCRVRNTCKYDPKSGCFEKMTCAKISDLSQCKNWQKELVCS